MRSFKLSHALGLPSVILHNGIIREGHVLEYQDKCRLSALPIAITAILDDVRTCMHRME